MAAARIRLTAAALLLGAVPVLLGLRTPLTAHADASSASIPITPVTQIYPLDCEAAALQMALSVVGIHVTQDQLLAQFGDDPRLPVMSNGEPVRWGDPYQTFVGNVSGEFVVTGYGVYYPPIVQAAINEGAAAYGGEGWQLQQILQEVAAGHPVVVRVPHLLIPASVGYWTAWDGRSVWYSHRDHAQTLVGYDDNAGTVTLADPADGQLHTYSMSAFESAWEAFHSQAIVVGAGGFSPAQAISPTNGSVNVAVQGPNHTLDMYWNVAGTWHGPLGIGGPGSANSAPAILAEPDGNFDIAVEGPDNTLDAYWDVSGTWYGPYQVGGPGTTFSTPSAIIDQHGHVTVAAQGPQESTYLYWNVNAQWYGAYGLGATASSFSAPELSLTRGATPTLQAVVQSGDAALQQYQENADGSWTGPTGWSQPNQAYSAAATTSPMTLFASGDDSLDYTVDGVPPVQLGTAGTTFSIPSTAAAGNTVYAAVEGPSHSLSFYTDQGGTWSAATQAAPDGDAFSAPSVSVEANGNVDVSVEGPGTTLYFFWRIGSTWYGPLQVGSSGSAHASLP